MKLIFIFIVTVFFIACSMSEPAITQYKIKTSIKEHQNNLKRCEDKSLKVSQSFSPVSLMSLKMNYALKDNKVYAYSQAQWSETPNRAISLEILKQTRDKKLFRYVQNFKTRSKNDLILETNIEDFTQYYDDNLSSSYANVVISFFLINAKDNEVIASKTFKSRIETKSLDALGGVDALNKALSDVLSNATTWLGEVCQ